MDLQRGQKRVTELVSVADIEEAVGAWNAPTHFSKLPIHLQFSVGMEAAFEASTGKQRANTLAKLTVSAIVLSYALIFSDYVFTPYLFRISVWLRLIPAPIGLFVVFNAGKSSAWIRETSISAYLLALVLVITLIASISREPLGPYTYYMASLCTVCAIPAYPLRFGYALAFAGLSVLAVAIAVTFYRHAGVAVSVASLFVIVLPLPFVLLSNWRAERSVRLSWLLTTRESLRNSILEADRAKLAKMATTDSLTGLANRGYFDQQLKSRLNSRFDVDRRVWLILLDVDFFKRYNDAYGHLAGDVCLRSVAQVLAQAVRSQEDVAFRYGGEEFGVLLFRTTDAEVIQIAERIRCRVEEAQISHDNRDDGPRVTTVSIGVSRAYLQNETTLKNLIDDADKALYEAKLQGRNRVRSALV